MLKKDQTVLVYSLAVLLLIAMAVMGYLAWNVQDKANQIAFLHQEKNELQTLNNQTKQSLLEATHTVEVLQSELNLTSEELNDLEKDYEREKNKNEDFEDQIEDLSDVLSDLDKLSKTDKELLQKYSKVYFLNENYVPVKLRQIDEEYILAGRDVQFFHANALPFLKDMLEAAKDDDIELLVSSAYRSFDQQAQLKGQYTTTYGTGANAFSADQGYSEHQLGTTVDLTNTYIAGPYTSFDNTTTFAWLKDNAYKYGFVLSYPEDNGFYIYEPWHWRFVGTDLARDLHRADAHFYDWDQRKIDSYLIKIFD